MITYSTQVTELSDSEEKSDRMESDTRRKVMRQILMGRKLQKDTGSLLGT